jgi:hypothetical protein
MKILITDAHSPLLPREDRRSIRKELARMTKAGILTHRRGIGWEYGEDDGDCVHENLMGVHALYSATLIEKASI